MKELTEFWIDGARDAEKMWASWQDKHRTHVMQALAWAAPFGSVYELGCGSGPNLRRLLHAYPGVVVGGSEPNEGLAAWAQEHLGVPVERETLPEIPVSSWDVTLSCYAMAYVDEPIVREALTRICSPRLVLIEPHAHVEPFGPPGLYQGHAMPSYAHDYRALLQDTGWSVLWRWPIYPHHQGLNVVTVAGR